MKKENFIIILIGIVTILLTIIPILDKQIVYDGDVLYHLERIQTLTDSLKQGIFPVKIHVNMANDYGYGTGLFYSNFFLYIPALIMLFGVNLIIAYKAFGILIMCAVFASSYISSKHIVKNKWAALFFAMMVVSSHYFLMNLFIRNAIGEMIAFVFMPLIIAGMWDIFNNNFRKPVFLIIGFIGLIYSHIISVVIALVYCVIYVIIYIKKLIKNKDIILKLLKCVLVVFVLTAAFTIPFLEQYFCQKYRFSVPWANPIEHITNLSYINDTFSLGTGLTLLLAIEILIIIIRFKYILNDIKIFAGLAIMFFLLPTFKCFWSLTGDYTGIIQFPWRLYGIATLLVAIIGSLLLEKYVKNNKLKVVIMIILVLVQLYFNLAFFKRYNICDVDNESTEKYVNMEDIGAKKPGMLIGQEYLPIELKEKELTTPYIAKLENGEEINGEKQKLKFYFKVSSIESQKCDIPFIYYRGYKAYIIYSDNTKEELLVQRSEKGLVQVILPEVEEGNVVVEYSTTVLQRIGYSITVIGTFAIIVYLIRKNEEV